MFSGRRVDLDQWMGEARALWQARLASSSHRARGWQVASALVLVTTFFVGLQSGYRLPQITVPELPSFIFPLITIAIAAVFLFTIKPHLNVNFNPNVNVSAYWDDWQKQMAFRTTRLQLRFSVQVALWVYRLRDLTSLLVLPRLLPDGNMMLLVNFALVSLHTWTSRIQTPRVAEALALHWQSALIEARRWVLSLLLLLEEFLGLAHASLLPALSSHALTLLVEQRTARSHSPLVLNLRC